jgi:GDP-D-mannose 3',5'-epimerase
MKSNNGHPMPGIRVVLVCGAGGFIGSHLVTALRDLGYYVIGADIKAPEFAPTDANSFLKVDLTKPDEVESLFNIAQPDHVYQLAADMGGADYIFSGLNDANVFHNSGLINFNIVAACVKYKVKRVFYSSSACVYPEGRQMEADSPALQERDAYPANPDSEYGWEKLMSERLYMAFAKNHDLEVRIARFHNIYGPLGTWRGGKEKAPAAFCRKAAAIELGLATDIEVYGDGEQTRSFLYIDECIKGVLRLMSSTYGQPLNIGSGEQVSINYLAKLGGWAGHQTFLMENEVIEGLLPEEKVYYLRHVPTTVQGVRGRSSDNNLIRNVLGWVPGEDLKQGLQLTYNWIKQQMIAEELTKVNQAMEDAGE